MKSILSFLLLISFQFCFAQVYHAFPDSNARWSEEVFYSFAENGTGIIIQQYCAPVISLGPDTIINSKKYTLVGYQSAWSYYIYKDDGDPFSIKNYPSNPPGTIMGAIREDSDKKIWYIHFSQYEPFCNDVGYWPMPIDSEVLLYDFDLHVGSVISFPYERSITAIDSIQLQDGSFRKEYEFPSQGGNPPEYWIEGIGSTIGLFGPYLQQLTPLSWDGTWLNCFWQNGQYLFQKQNIPIGITCDSLNAWDLNYPQTSSFISPNPFTTSTTIQFNLDTTSQTSLQVFDMNGIRIKTLLQNETLNAGTHSVNFYEENHPLGVYFYVFSSNEKTEVGKIILAR